MANEAVTEDTVRDILSELGYFADGTDVVVERQQSKVAAIKRLLIQASKTGGAG